MDKSTNLKIIKGHDEAILLKILEAIKSVSYGSVLITIHNSQVVQIEKTDKIRVKELKSCVCS